MTKAYEYAKAVVSDDYSKTHIIKELQSKYKAPRYIKKQCQEFINISDGKDKKYIVDDKKIELIEKLLKAMTMPSGRKIGQSLYEATCDYQWFLYTNVFAVVERDDHKSRKYETVLMEVARKNFKSFSCGTMFILMMLLEENFSKFFSVAPNGELSGLVKEAVEAIIKSSKAIYYVNGKDDSKGYNFKVINTGVKCLLNNNSYKPLNYTISKFDGREPKGFIADEVGALPVVYPVEAMKTGQKLLKNKLGCIISTKYPRLDNPFEEYVAEAKGVLDGNIQDEHFFSLLYEPDETKEWQSDDLILMQANPALIEDKELWEGALADRQKAIEIDSKRENFLTKTCNIIYQGMGTENYVSIDDVLASEVEDIDWNDVAVEVGVDLSMSNDNVAVAIAGIKNDEVVAEVMIFVPDGNIEEKTRNEKLDYKQCIERGECIACGDRIIDYSVVEDYVFKLEEKKGCIIDQIGYDKWNCISSAQKWETKYSTVEIKQHSSTLHEPTKLLRDDIVKHTIKIKKSKILEINFENCRLTYDTNMNMYVNKKRSMGKVDGVVALINAMCLLKDKIQNNGIEGAQF